MQNRVLFKRKKRLEVAEVTKNYKLCDQLSEEIADLNKSKRLLEVELSKLQKKEKRSKWYYERKPESDSDSSSSQMSSSSAASKSIYECSPPFNPPAKEAPPRFTSPPPLSVSAPSTPRPVSPFGHVHSISICPPQLSPQHKADVSSVRTDQATPRRPSSSDYSLSLCPPQLSPQHEAGVSSVRTDQATPRHPSSSDYSLSFCPPQLSPQLEAGVSSVRTDQVIPRRPVSGVQETCEEATGSTPF